MIYNKCTNTANIYLLHSTRIEDKKAAWRIQSPPVFSARAREEANIGVAEQENTPNKSTETKAKKKIAAECCK
jgi:hypothetical protein